MWSGPLPRLVGFERVGEEDRLRGRVASRHSGVDGSEEEEMDEDPNVKSIGEFMLRGELNPVSKKEDIVRDCWR